MKNESILLLALSVNRDSNQEKTYVFEESGKSYIGRQTNDAPIRCLLDYANFEGNPVSKVLYISTRDVLKVDGGKAVRHLSEIVQSACEEYGIRVPELVAIPYDYKGDSCEEIGRGERGSNIYSNIEMALKEAGGQSEENGAVYIDYTGGFRDVTFLMTSIMKYFEFMGNECRKIVYSSKEDGKIYSIDNVYRMYHLINGVQSFTSNGDSKEIREYFKDSSAAGYAVAESMCNFADAISICDVRGIDHAIDLLNDSISTFENLGADDMDSRMLKSLLPFVKQKLFLSGDGKRHYAELIEWCRSNHLIQQAITLFVEKMPVVLLSGRNIAKLWNCLETRCGISTADIRKKIAAGEYADAFYSCLFDAFPAEDRALILRFKNYCETLAGGIPNEDATYDDIKKSIGLLSNAEKDAALKTAFTRLNRFLIENYRDGFLNKPCRVYGRDIRQKNLKSFINTLAIDGRLLHYFIFNDENAYVKQRELDKGSENTPLRKKESLKQFKKTADNDIIHKLYDVMVYYLAIKMIRNNLNHASENEDNNALREAKKYLREEGVTIDADEPVKYSSAETMDRYDYILRKGLSACNRFAECLEMF